MTPTMVWPSTMGSQSVFLSSIMSTMWVMSAPGVMDSTGVIMRSRTRAGTACRCSRPVPEPRFPGEHRDHLSDDAEQRDRHDVHLGMPEEAQQVLIQDRAAVGRAEHMRPEMPVRGQA